MVCRKDITNNLLNQTKVNVAFTTRHARLWSRCVMYQVIVTFCNIQLQVRECRNADKHGKRWETRVANVDGLLSLVYQDRHYEM